MSKPYGGVDAEEEDPKHSSVNVQTHRQDTRQQQQQPSSSSSRQTFDEGSSQLKSSGSESTDFTSPSKSLKVFSKTDYRLIQLIVLPNIQN